MSPEHQSFLAMLVVVPLVGYALYRRARRHFGKQRLESGRMIFRLVLLSLVGAFVVATAKTILGALTASIGVVAGGALAVLSLRRTKFERSSGTLFYTPDTWIGIAVTSVFVGRLAARFVTVYSAVSRLEAGAMAPVDAHRSPLTGALVLLMVGYYVVYYAGILRRSRAIAPSEVPPMAPLPATIDSHRPG